MIVDPSGKPTNIRRTARKRLKNGVNQGLKTKTTRNKDGKMVRMVRIRRKKQTKGSNELASPNSIFGSDRVTLSDEIGKKAAPVQAKPNAVGAKRTRYRSVQPGLNHLVKKGHVDPFGRGTAKDLTL